MRPIDPRYVILSKRRKCHATPVTVDRKGVVTASRMSDNTMKLSFVRSTLFVLFGLFLCPPVAGLASSPPADSVHFCALFDYEQWRRDHPRPAAKRPANLNAGEPRRVRMIYFVPNDRPFRQEVVDSIKVRMRQAQAFFSGQMEAHGHGNPTLRVESDAQGEPLVHRVDGQHPDSHYLDVTGIVYDEIDQAFDLEENIYLIVVDNSINAIGIGGADGQEEPAGVTRNEAVLWSLAV